MQIVEVRVIFGFSLYIYISTSYCHISEEILRVLLVNKSTEMSYPKLQNFVSLLFRTRIQSDIIVTTVTNSHLMCNTCHMSQSQLHSHNERK